MKAIVSRCIYRYKSQSDNQRVVADLYPDGKVYIGYNPEIGGGYPASIANLTSIRFYLPKNYTANDARSWYRRHKIELKSITQGWSVIGPKGRLSDESKKNNRRHRI